MQKVAVIGLGRFGIAVARSLAASRVHVIAIDRNGQLVADLKDDVDLAVRLDATDEHALLSQDVDKVDVAIVSIGENFEAALLATVMLKRLGVPMVICRAQTQFHGQIFAQIGADRVIQPEQESGEHLARQLANPHLVDLITLAEGYSLIEYRTPEEFVGKSLSALSIRHRYGVNLVVVKRPIVASTPTEEGETPAVPIEPVSYEVIVPQAETVIEQNDVLVVVGADTSLARLPKE